MRIRTPNGLLTIGIITLLFTPAVIYIPWTPVRVILGFPLLLFFPGYALLSVLFVNEQSMDGIERLAISCAMSISIVALIGFGLNFTIWGIRLETVLYSLAAFVIVALDVALIRRARASVRGRLFVEFRLRLPHWKTGGASKAVSFLLIALIVAAVGVLGYVSTAARAKEAFTEFYVLGLDGRARDYPTSFVVDGSQIVSVIYGADREVDGGWGEVTLGIVDHEERTMTYSVSMKVDGEPAQFSYEGALVDQVEGIELRQGDRWEKTVRFAPQRIGENQKVEFLLSKGATTDAQDSLSLWISTTAVAP